MVSKWNSGFGNIVLTMMRSQYLIWQHYHLFQVLSLIPPKWNTDLQTVSSYCSWLQEVGGCGISADGSRLGRLCRLHGSWWEGGVLLTSGEGGLLPPWSTQSSDGETESVCVEARWRSCSFTRGVKDSNDVCLYIIYSYKRGCREINDIFTLSLETTSTSK